RQVKKPPGGPGGFVWVSGDDASRRYQLHLIHYAQVPWRINRGSAHVATKRQAAFLSSFTALSTSSTWPGTFRPRHSCFSTPSEPMRKVLRSIPLTFLPYMILFFTTPNMWHIFSSVSAISSNGSSSLALKSSCDFMLSRDTPNTAAPALTKSLYLSRNCIASVVQPGVLSFG